MIFGKRFFESRSAGLWLRGGEVYGIDDLFRAETDFHAALEFFYGKRVALSFSSQTDYYEAICLLCGVARELVLLSADMSTEERETLIEKSGVDFLIGGGVRNDCWVRSGDGGRASRVTREPIETVITMPTSGTTGVPKLISHTLDRLTSTTKVDVEFGKNICWVMMYDVNRFAGLQVFLQSILGGSLLISKGDNGQDLRGFIAMIARLGGNAISATPTMWRKILMHEESKKLDLFIISMGGEIADQATLTALKGAYPCAKVTHIYASTEAGVGFSVADGMAGFPRKWINDPFRKVALKVDECGKLWVKSQRCSISGPSLIVDEQGYIDTGDLVEIKEDRVFFLGRESGTINVGGNKVQPEEVEAVLLSFPQVSIARVYAKKSAMIGQIVCADIVLDLACEKSGIKEGILAHCRAKLPSYKVPAILRFVDCVEVNANGKIKRG